MTFIILMTFCYGTYMTIFGFHISYILHRDVGVKVANNEKTTPEDWENFNNTVESYYAIPKDIRDSMRMTEEELKKIYKDL